MCEIVGKRFIKFWAHADFVYRWTDLYRVQQKHCDTIGVLTNRVSMDTKTQMKRLWKNWSKISEK